VANNPRTTPVPAPATTTTPPAGQGTISLTGVPNGAHVTVDAQPKTGGRFKVPAGSHVVEVALQGFNTYRTTVNVAPGQTQTVPITMAAATAAVTTPTPTTAATPAGVNPACASPTGNLMPRNRCWDTRPNPRTPLQLTPPGTCHGTVTPANILVNVSAQGEVISASMSRGSSCREFTDAAVSQVQDMTFTPATRGGAPVAAWTIVVMRPAR
jgi:TonB family protein